MPHPTDARRLPVAQQSVLETLAMLTRGGGGGPVTISDRSLAAHAGVTPKQCAAAINSLISGAYLTKAWNPDRYLWAYTLTADKYLIDPDTSVTAAPISHSGK